MRGWWAGVLVAGLACGAPSLAEEGYLTNEEVIIRTEGPHRLRLPKDWPVERREDGVLAPIPFEAYLSKKFGQVRAQFEAGDRRLEALERRLEELAQAYEALVIRVRSLEHAVQAQP